MKERWMALNGKLRERLRMIAWVIILTLGWYLFMMPMEIPREILMGVSGELPGNGVAISLLFCLLTGGMITAFFYQSPGIKRRGLRILFSLPFPFVASAIFVLSVSLVNEIGKGNFPMTMDFWASHFIFVPLFLLLIAWLPLLVMHPVTVAVSEMLIRKRIAETTETASMIAVGETQEAAS